ncbi:MAG: DUF3179 domain-containing (seleno)protein [Actinomycetota bacterium]
MSTRRFATALAATLALAACASDTDESGSGSGADGDTASGQDATGSADGDAPEEDAERSDEEASASAPATDPVAAAEAAIDAPRPRFRYPDPPDAPSIDEANVDADAAIERIIEGVQLGFFDAGGVTLLAESGDPRHGWFVSDLLRFFQGPDATQLTETFEIITGVDPTEDPDAERSFWLPVTNHLIAWDTPAYEGYVEDKAALFTLLEPGWTPFFEDEDSTIDWRVVSWGGVFIDDRPLGDPLPCPGGCIPALDDFRTTDAAGGDWYPDERIVFGLEVNGEALAVPLNIAEIHEMFNFTLGDRRIAMPYCTLCGSAQAYFTDQVDGSPTEGADEVPVLRTSGLLSLSNKVMYDLVTSSVFDTFTGAAVSGPLLDSGVELEEITVVRSTWSEWKNTHPDTQIIAEDGGIERRYALDPLGGRDDDGPIFPIGEADDRLDVQELVVGVLLDDGTALAFPSEAATAAIDAGGDVELDGVRLESSGDGLVAVDATSGDPIAAHEAFWFAWSQFHPDTGLWLPR